MSSTGTSSAARAMPADARADAPPSVSVAIPTFRRLALLKRAVESALAQDHPDLQVIVSDNASGDGTAEWLRSLDDPRLTVLTGDVNVGMVGNWDACLRAARGECFVLLSDDDALRGPDALASLARALCADDSIGVAFCDVTMERVGPDGERLEDTRGARDAYRAAEAIVDFFENRLSIFPCATMLRTEDLRALGGYGAFGVRLAADACAWIAVACRRGRIARVPRPLALYRVHASLSSSSVETWSHDLDVLRALFERESEGRLSAAERDAVRRAMREAWHRTPLGYVGRRWRDDPDYGWGALAADLLRWRRRLLVPSNLRFVAGRLARRISRGAPSGGPGSQPR